MKLDDLIFQYRYALLKGAPLYILQDMEKEIIEEELKLGKHRQPNRTLHSGSPGASSNRPGGITYLTPAQLAQLSATSERAKPRPIKETGIRAGEIIAWRTWEVVGGLLASTFAPGRWRPGVIKTAHADPAKENWYRHNENHIGIFAWKTKKLAEVHKIEMEMFDIIDLSTALMFNRRHEPLKIVIGQVQLWGSIVEHELGYRAEFAKVHKIFDRALAARYGVPHE